MVRENSDASAKGGADWKSAVRPCVSAPPLRGPANDVSRIASVLSDPDRGGFAVYPLIDGTSIEIVTLVDEILGEAEINDTVLIYYSGHGKLDFRRNLYFAARNTLAASLVATGVPAHTIKTLIENSRAAVVILLLDCCYSGAIGHEFSRGEVSEQLDLVGDDLSGPRGGTGIHIFTSSSATQTSREKEITLDGTVLGEFTHLLVNGIATGAADIDRNGEIDIEDLKRFLYRGAREQTPRYWGVDTAGDVWIARCPEIRRELAAQRAEKLSEWHAAGKIPEVVYDEAVTALNELAEGKKLYPAIDTTLRLLDEGGVAARRFAAAWMRDGRQRRRPRLRVAVGIVLGIALLAVWGTVVDWHPSSGTSGIGPLPANVSASLTTFARCVARARDQDQLQMMVALKINPDPKVQNQILLRTTVYRTVRDSNNPNTAVKDIRDKLQPILSSIPECEGFLRQ